MNLENQIHKNFIKDIEFIHEVLNEDRHEGVNMRKVYNTFLTDICERNNMFDKDEKGIKINPVRYHISNAHFYYVGRYNIDWTDNTSYEPDNRIPSFLLRDQVI